MTLPDLLQRLPLMRKFFPKAPVGAVFSNGRSTVVIIAYTPKYNTHGTLVELQRQLQAIMKGARLERKVYVYSNFHLDWLLEDGYRRIA